MAGPTRVISIAFSTDSAAPEPGAFICVMGDRHIFRINRCCALQPAAAACSSCEPLPLTSLVSRRRCSALRFLPYAAALFSLQLLLAAVTEGCDALCGSGGASV